MEHQTTLLGVLPDMKGEEKKQYDNLQEERHLSAEQEAALERILSLNLHLGGVAPSRDELYERNNSCGLASRPNGGS